RSTLLSGLVALFLQSIFFGTLLVVYGVTTWILLFREKTPSRSQRNFLFFGAATVMFILALVHMSLDLDIILLAFLSDSRDSLEVARTLDAYNALQDPTGAAKFAIYATQTLIGDGFMIYRAYMVWNRTRLVVIVPSILLFGEVVLGYATAFLGRFNVSTQRTTDCVNAFFVVSVVTNLVCTGLIVKRTLWSHGGAQSRTACKSQLKTVRWRVVESLVQSAAVYSIASISLAVTSFLSPSIGFPACHSAFPSVIGVVFLLIVIRISLNGATADCRRCTLRRSMAEGASCTSLPGAVGVEGHQPHSARRGPIAIKVSVSTTSDSASVLSSCNE
ncbi:hypothetical protein BD413DRAFT_439493, partial [Trametes elegans]